MSNTNPYPSPRETFQSIATPEVWKWVMKQVKHGLNREQIIFLYWAFHDGTAVEPNGESYESIIRRMMDKVYDGAARDFVIHFWNNNGTNWNDKWILLYKAVQDMIIDLKSFINDRNDDQAKGQRADDTVNETAVNRKRKRPSAITQESSPPTKKRRRSSLTF